MKAGYFKTAKRLEIALDNINRIDGMEDYINCHIESLYDIDLNDTFEAPYWALEGSIDYYLTGTKEQREYDPNNLICEYSSGYWCEYEQYDEIEIDGQKARFLTSLPMGEELEFQADDGGLAYYYTGPQYINVFEIIED